MKQHWTPLTYIEWTKKQKQKKKRIHEGEQTTELKFLCELPLISIHCYQYEHKSNSSMTPNLKQITITEIKVALVW